MAGGYLLLRRDYGSEENIGDASAHPNRGPIIAGLAAPKNVWFQLPDGIGAGIALRDNANEFMPEIMPA